jgi:predicted nuclease with RNAse H fold
VIESIHVGVQDEQVIDAVASARKVGIDCPLGWPLQFEEFLAQHQRGWVADPARFAGIAGRRALVWRETDTAVRRETGLTPLSASADRIAHVAIRCAVILAACVERGVSVERSGSGVVCEVYPAASLKAWGLPHRRYKGIDGRDVLAALVEGLKAGAPWLELGVQEDLLRRNDHAADSLVAALTALAAVRGYTTRPGRAQQHAAEREGWIAVPTVGLAALGNGSVGA